MLREDFSTACWQRLQRHLRDRLDALRLQNDRLVNTETQTASIRGRIDEVKELLALANTASASDAAGPGLLDWLTQPAAQAA